MKGKIIVFMQNKPFLGAQIVQIPFFYFLRRDYPGIEIIGIAPDKSSWVLSEYKFLDREYNYPRKKKIFAIMKYALQLRSEGVHRVFQHRKHSMKTTIAAKIAAGKSPIVGFKGDITRWFYTKEIPFNFNKYMADVYLELTGHSLKEFHDHIEKESPVKEKIITIIPGGSKEFKKYPLEKYVQIATHFEPDYTIQFILGPDMQVERNYLKKFDNKYRIVYNRSLHEVEDCIRKSSLVLANDCGPSHFAHVFNIPRITLFASEIDVKQWFYPSTNSAYFASERRDNIESIPESRIIEKAEQLLESLG